MNHWLTVFGSDELLHDMLTMLVKDRARCHRMNR